VSLLYDPEPGVAHTAQYCLGDGLRERLGDASLDTGALRSILAEDGPASLFALEVLEARGQLSDKDRKHLLGSTNLAVVSSAFTPLRYKRYKFQLDDLNPLITNSLPMARLIALGVLTEMADKPAVERIISLLHDPNEAIRWQVRSALRRLTGQKLGANSVAYEKWWAENKATYVPMPTNPRSR
jgi:hypothetical protein